MIFNDLAELIEELRSNSQTKFIDEVPKLAICPDGDLELISRHHKDNSIPAGEFEGSALYFTFPKGVLPDNLADALEEAEVEINGLLNEISPHLTQGQVNT